MPKVTSIQDRSAVVVWSPFKDHCDIVALGAKVRFGKSNHASDILHEKRVHARVQ